MVSRSAGKTNSQTPVQVHTYMYMYVHLHNHACLYVLFSRLRMCLVPHICMYGTTGAHMLLSTTKKAICIYTLYMYYRKLSSHYTMNSGESLILEDLLNTHIES